MPPPAASAATSRKPATRLRSLHQRVHAYLFDEQRFVGNRDHYEDPRNSCLNEVLDRRTGIPITLSVVYMEVGLRAGLRIDGVNFPDISWCGCRSPARVRRRADHRSIHSGAMLSEHDCGCCCRSTSARRSVQQVLLAPATRPQIVARMLLNLKRIYVHMRSFPQRRDVTELLLGVTPSALSELRDRGLPRYHLNDVTSALRDLAPTQAREHGRNGQGARRNTSRSGSM